MPTAHTPNSLAAAIARDVDRQQGEKRLRDEQAVRDFVPDAELERLIERREADRHGWRMVNPMTKAAVQSYENRRRLHAELTANEGNDAA